MKYLKSQKRLSDTHKNHIKTGSKPLQESILPIFKIVDIFLPADAPDVIF
jgi:hypothetical protein